MQELITVNRAIDEVCCLFIAVLIIHLVIRQTKDITSRLFLLLSAATFCMIFFDYLFWSTFLQEGHMEEAINQIASYFINLFCILVPLILGAYLVFFLKIRLKTTKLFAGIMLLLFAMDLILLLISQFSPMFAEYTGLSVYQPGMVSRIFQLIKLLLLVMDFQMLLYHSTGMRKSEFLSIVGFVMIPMIAAVLQISHFGALIIDTGMAVTLFAIYFNAQLAQLQLVAEQKKELEEKRISIMLSQIQPHFLYNTLTSIQMLCSIDAEEARNALGDFSKFLRANMDSLKSLEPIPFIRELEHVTNYLHLEQLRFEDDLEVIYDLRARDFFLPALTIQPIVENAVKYGFSKSDVGEVITIRISTYKEENFYVVEIQDNGSGFDAAGIEEIPTHADGRSHIGLSNVQSRVRQMSGGDVILHSQSGMGTTVKILIPCS